MPELNELKRIEVPTFIIKGAQTCKIKDGAPELHAALPNSTLKTLAYSCHDPWYNQTEEFFELGGKFILKVIGEG